MSDADFRKQQAANARENLNEARLNQLRADLAPLRGRTLWIDVASAVTQLTPRVLAQLVAVRDDAIEVIDLGDASIAPSEKPRLTIGLGAIRDWRLT